MSNLRKKLKNSWIRVAALLLIYDVLAVNLSYGLALWLRFDCSFSRIPEIYASAYLHFIPIHTACSLILFLLLNLYRSIWSFASFRELERTFIATALSALFHTIGITVLFQRMPVAYYLFGPIFEFILITCVRFSYRLLRVFRSWSKSTDQSASARIMIIGAGDGGRMLIQELVSSRHLRCSIKCVIDDNPYKWGRYISGVPVVGGRDDILANVKKYEIDHIYFAIPTASPEEKRDILNICKESGCALKSLPGLYQLINGEVSVSQLRDVSVEELLGRDPIKVDLDQILGYVSGKTVLVTGGGGSIGSELCRQLASHNVKQLILFDVYENTTYDIEQELRMNHPDLNLVTLIGSVCDIGCIEQVFEKYHPEIVYHAAAHKHVPLMEDSPAEAIKNNIFGTRNLLMSASEHGVRRLVQLSTDKAVNPTNVMGATKRVTEMLIQQTARRTKMKCMAVRFGNVLGSHGSVIPLFESQIKRGGPVTVTHPDITRYFMTIPEAAQLVLQAGAIAESGAIFVLDMAKPVKMMDLAKQIIRFYGYTPNVDMPIKITGLRPGEKLYEELMMDGERDHMRKTVHNKIFVAPPIPFDDDELDAQLETLRDAAARNDEEAVNALQRIVTTYTPNRKPMAG